MTPGGISTVTSPTGTRGSSALSGMGRGSFSREPFGQRFLELVPDLEHHGRRERPPRSEVLRYPWERRAGAAR